MLGNGPVRFGGRPHGKGPAQRAPRRAATQFRSGSLAVMPVTRIFGGMISHQSG